MSVTVRPYRSGGWEVDIRLTLPDNSEHRERRKAPVSSKSAAQRWGEDRERLWYQELTRPQPDVDIRKEAPTLEVFWPRFLDGYPRANRQKPSGIAAKETIGRVHLIPILGRKRLDQITTETVRRSDCCRFPNRRRGSTTSTSTNGWCRPPGWIGTRI